MNQEYTVNPYEESPQASPSKAETDRKLAKKYAIASLILSLCALLFSTVLFAFLFLAPVCAIVSILFAVLARKKEGRFSKLALIGLVISILALILFLVLFVLILQFTAYFQNMPTEEFNALFEETFGIPYESFVEDFLGISYEEFMTEQGKLP